MKKNYRIVALVLGLLAIGLILVPRTGWQNTSLLKNPESPEQKHEPNAEANDWMARQRAYPYGQIKLESYLKSMDQARQMHDAENSRFEWELVGPTNIGGRITDLAIKPGDKNTIYVAGATGGIMKSTDQGASWKSIFTDAAVISVGDLATDPQQADVLWAGTGEANAASFSFYGNGIYKSEDGGESWAYKGLEHSAYIGRIIVDHQNSKRVWAAACGNLFTQDSHRGIYRTDDGGESWQQVLYINDSVSGIDLVQHPQDANIIYAAMWERMRGLNYRNSFGDGSGIYRSDDGGDTWTELTDGLPTGTEVGRIGLSMCASEPDNLYAFYDNRDEVAVYRTQNGGANWTRTNDNNLQGMNSSFGWYFGQIRVAPSNPECVYVMGVEMYRSDNGGNSWVELASYANFDEIHVDHHAMWIDPDNGELLQGNDGGLYKSANQGSDWAKINNLPLTQFYYLDIDDLNPHRLYGGTQDNNTVRTWNGGVDDWEAILGGDGFYCLVDYTNSNIIYAESQWGNLRKSTNGGNWFDDISWAFYDDRKNWSAPLIMHPTDPNTLYFGTQRVWKTTNGGDNWTAVSADLTDGGDGSSYHTVTTLAISSVNEQVVMAGTDDGHVHISTDAGSSWNEITTGLPKRWITRVATDPFEENTVYVTVSGFRWDEPLPHVFKSTDLGQTWIDISGNLPELPVNIIQCDPGAKDHLIVGTDAGVFMTKDGGVNWFSIAAGLGNVPVVAMDIDKTNRDLVVGTYGLSARKISLDDLSVGMESQVVVSEQNKFEVYPNIVRSGQSQITIKSNLSEGQLSWYDMSGRQLDTQYVKDFSDAGIQLQLPNAVIRQQGTYILRLTQGSRAQQARIIVQ